MKQVPGGKNIIKRDLQEFLELATCQIHTPNKAGPESECAHAFCKKQGNAQSLP